MAADQETPLCLDDEQRSRVTDCLSKEVLSLPPDRLEEFIGGIEASIAHFRETPVARTPEIVVLSLECASRALVGADKKFQSSQPHAPGRRR